MTRPRIPPCPSPAGGLCLARPLREGSASLDPRGRISASPDPHRKISASPGRGPLCHTTTRSLTERWCTTSQKRSTRMAPGNGDMTTPHPRTDQSRRWVNTFPPEGDVAQLLRWTSSTGNMVTSSTTGRDRLPMPYSIRCQQQHESRAPIPPRLAQCRE